MASKCPHEHLGLLWQINRLLLVTDKEDKGGEKEENSAVSEYQSTVQEFRAFLSDCKDVLDEATTVKLLGRYSCLHLWSTIMLASELYWHMNLEEEEKIPVSASLCNLWCLHQPFRLHKPVNPFPQQQTNQLCYMEAEFIAV
jgi:hypothetical protein